MIAVSAAHREAALAACKEAIDTLKQTVPLWKKELYVGGEAWIGQGSYSAGAALRGNESRFARCPLPVVASSRA